jgi:hypothetical protein
MRAEITAFQTGIRAECLAEFLRQRGHWPITLLTLLTASPAAAPPRLRN